MIISGHRNGSQLIWLFALPPACSATLLSVSAIMLSSSEQRPFILDGERIRACQSGIGDAKFSNGWLPYEMLRIIEWRAEVALLINPLSQIRVNGLLWKYSALSRMYLPSNMGLHVFGRSFSSKFSLYCSFFRYPANSSPEFVLQREKLPAAVLCLSVETYPPAQYANISILLTIKHFQVATVQPSLGTPLSIQWSVTVQQA